MKVWSQWGGHRRHQACTLGPNATSPLPGPSLHMPGFWESPLPSPPFVAVGTSTVISLLLEITCVRLRAAAAAVILKDHLPRLSEHEITFNHPFHPNVTHNTHVSQSPTFLIRCNNFCS